MLKIDFFLRVEKFFNLDQTRYGVSHVNLDSETKEIVV